jgi:hypothetical protein
MLTSCATVTPLNMGDINMANNTACITKAVATSFDPNDKTVQPEGYGAPGYITLQDQVLDYQVRFQNTGTAPAQNIYILDTLSDKLDIQTLEVIGYSHPYQIEIIDGHILKFKFNQIMLPDSGTNQQASHGYVIYRIKQKTTNQIGDVIQNTASIYFDYNSPIITNTTTNTIGFPVRVNTINGAELSWSVYPNPAHDQVQVLFQSSDIKGNSELAVYDAVGKKVLVKSLSANPSSSMITLDVSGLAKGVYYIHLGSTSKKITLE